MALGGPRQSILSGITIYLLSTLTWVGWLLVPKTLLWILTGPLTSCVIMSKLCPLFCTSIFSSVKGNYFTELWEFNISVPTPSEYLEQGLALNMCYWKLILITINSINVSFVIISLSSYLHFSPFLLIGHIYQDLGKPKCSFVHFGCYPASYQWSWK